MVFFDTYEDNELKNYFKEREMKLLDILKEEITFRELKDFLRGKPYDIQVLSRFMMDKVKNFNGLGYPCL